MGESLKGSRTGEFVKFYRAFMGILSEFIGEWLGAVDINIYPMKNGDPRSNLVEDKKPLPIGLAR